jgi:hypothetical protein
VPWSSFTVAGSTCFECGAEREARRQLDGAPSLWTLAVDGTVDDAFVWSLRHRRTAAKRQGKR